MGACREGSGVGGVDVIIIRRRGGRGLHDPLRPPALQEKAAARPGRSRTIAILQLFAKMIKNANICKNHQFGKLGIPSIHYNLYPTRGRSQDHGGRWSGSSGLRAILGQEKNSFFDSVPASGPIQYSRSKLPTPVTAMSACRPWNHNCHVSTRYVTRDTVALTVAFCKVCHDDGCF